VALYAQRLAEAGIKVFEIRPGIIRTDMIAKVEQVYEAKIAGVCYPSAAWAKAAMSRKRSAPSPMPPRLLHRAGVKRRRRFPLAQFVDRPIGLSKGPEAPSSHTTVRTCRIRVSSMSAGRRLSYRVDPLRDRIPPATKRPVERPPARRVHG